MARLTPFDARNLANSHGFPLGRDFHSLDSASVKRILNAANACKYREPPNANGSRARYFYAYLNRTLTAKVPEYVVQGNHGFGHGWEDETTETSHREARARLREYRENAPSGSYRIVTRRVSQEA
jgi:hypothetical protein